MKKRSAIIGFIVVGIVTIIGLLATFVSFPVGTYDWNGFMGSIKLGLDLQGGVYAVYQAADTEDTDNLDNRMNGTVSQLSELLAAKGYTEASIVREGTNRIRVEVPDVDDPEKIFDIIGEPASIQFILESSGETVLTGDHIVNAYASVDENSPGYYAVSLSLNDEGRRRFGDATTNNIGQTIRIDVTRGGETTSISTATINTAITGGQAQITGNFTLDAAQELADQIMSGTFSVTLNLRQSSVVSPTLGENAFLAGIIGGAIAIVLIMLFMAFYYKMLGVVACMGMVIYVVLMFIFLGILPWVQLTLPGIAGIILSLGMMIDGNVIIYERIKGEFRAGKSILASYYAGFKKATAAILDGNITTIIAAVMLLIFGTGSVQGFGLTLLVGLVLSIFSSLVVTKYLLRWVLALNSTDRKLFGLKRDASFDESKEEQYVAKQKKEEPDGVPYNLGALPEGASNE